MKELGQYFTTNKKLQDIVYKFIKNNPKYILEPSSGRGDLVKYINSKNSDIIFDCYEIDGKIKFIINKDLIEICDFLKKEIKKSYKTIVGNPPYVSTKTGNLYIEFINKCVDLLELEGELIFIIPSDFFKLTSAIPTLDKMFNNGYFTDIYHPHDEHLFKNAQIDILIFRYVKSNKKSNKVRYNDKMKYVIRNGGLVSFTNDIKKDGVKLNELFEIYVGIVSAKEEVYKNKEYGNIEILVGENKREKYIYIEKFPTKNSELNKYMLENKEKLMARKIKKFNENNWFEWGALRNIEKITKNAGKKCLYVKNLTREDNICFKDKVQYFGGSLLILIPKRELDLNKIMRKINDERDQFKYSGRYKIGHRQLSNLLIEY